MNWPLGRLILVGALWSGSAAAQEPSEPPAETTATRPMRAGELARSGRKKTDAPPASAESTPAVDAVARDPGMAPASERLADPETGAVAHGPQVGGVLLDPDEPAAEPDLGIPAGEDPAGELTTEEGVWTWVARMEGEIPDPEIVQGTEELFEQERAESPLVDAFAGGVVPTGFYADPASALTGDSLYLDLVDPSEFDIPIAVNDEVAKWVRYFTGDGRKYYARWMARSTVYRPMMYAKLEEAGLPRDLVYLSMIESGYNAHAYSSAAAVGLWQFIASTGRLYDLRVDWWLDERRDPEKSTDSAIAFLSELHAMFGKWELAWAAYNTGPGRVRRAVSSSVPDDFWTIAAASYLHSETDNYVPKIMAAAIIGKHPERYGFTDIPFQPELRTDTVTVDGMVEIAVLARCAGIDEETFKHLNPALRRWSTPEGKTKVNVPEGSRETFVAALDRVPKSERITFVRHKVARGETLSVIASRYGVGVAEMVRANNLGNADRIFVGMTLIVPTAGSEEVAAAMSGAPTREAVASAPPTARPRSHVVKSGDTLSGIAARYDVGLSDVRSWNGLRGDTIYVGQTIALQGSSSSGSTASASSGGSSSGTRTVRYTVRSGDNLSAIASRYGVTLADMQRWNNVRDPSRIYSGQVLTVHVSDSGWDSYTVRAGDSLGAIGDRHGCSVSDLVAWNSLSTTVIHPGQTLKVRRTGG